MYFVNNKGFIVQSILHDKSDVCSSEVKTFVTDEELKQAFPDFTDEMISEIPHIHVDENSSGTYYSFNGKYGINELIFLEHHQEIGDWIAEQTETYCSKDGLMF